MNIFCFFLTPTNRCVHYILRYKYCSNKECSSYIYGHRASKVVLYDGLTDGENGYWRPHSDINYINKEDPAWPTHCACGYKFTKEDEYSSGSHRLYIRSDNNEETTIGDAGPGAMWFADWMGSYNGMGIGPDGHSLMVRTPGGDWCVDSRASNCTMPEDNEHRCWIRTGEPPIITVGKNGFTCAAGAGSILCGNYHGFLRNGVLEDA
jgi:hypothetical protein